MQAAVPRFASPSGAPYRLLSKGKAKEVRGGGLNSWAVSS